LYAERPEHEAFLSVANHFIAVGYLLKRKMMDYETASLLPIGMTWKKLKPIVGVRLQFNSPKMYEEFEYLYNEMKKREQRR